jgi:fucose permease
MSAMNMMTAATISGALIFGMALALLGRLKLALARCVSEPRTQQGEVSGSTSHLLPSTARTARSWLSALNIALIPLMLLSGVLLDIYGARAALAAGPVMLAVGLVVLSLRPTYPHAWAALLLAGFGASALGTASIVLMPQAFSSTANAAGPPPATAALNLGFVFLALGALLTSVLTDILLEKIELRRMLAVFALLSLAPAFLGVLPENAHWQMAEQRGQPSALFAESACWLTALVLFFYVPLEASISLWTFSLLAERGQEERTAAGLLSGFWAAFVASRLATALAFAPLGARLGWAWERTLIVVLPLVAAVLLGNLAGAGQGGRPRGGLVLLGLLLGPVLPTLLSVVFRAAPEEKGTAFGLMFAFGSVGSMVLAPFLSLRLPIFLALLVAAVALVLGLMML